KYPQNPFPYQALIAGNRARGRRDPEYELLDTGVFDGDRYFDVFLEYAKATPEDILVRIGVANRGPVPAMLHVLPTLWFRNTWSWGEDPTKPEIRAGEGFGGAAVMVASHRELGERYLYCERDPELLFTGNETNTARLFGAPNATP